MEKEKNTLDSPNATRWGGTYLDLPGTYASSRPELYAPGTLIPSGICNIRSSSQLV
ncbi:MULTISPECIES: hypothetical protein [Methanosarcina]|uniref:hypothetical protein n=1 Tax=Methanosarcina TaxID=2207 RepID=UPI000B2A193A|nr:MULTISPECIES: hypothetical protein [Methanosarcina]